MPTTTAPQQQYYLNRFLAREGPPDTDPESDEVSRLPRTIAKAVPSEELAREKGTLQTGDNTPGRDKLMEIEIGADIAGFEILEPIGEGAFARVFLARQNELSERQVVLKITQEKKGEAQVLAQLLHSNIVPIYSQHNDGPLHITCMPFLGTTTLADVLSNVRAQGMPGSGKELVHTLQAHISTRNMLSQTRSGRDRFPDSHDQQFAASLVEAPRPISQPRTRLILDRLESMSYSEAILNIAAQLADGLAHAHERGILHRDLKPANILLTDEGQPMLLDFNLAEDTKLRGSSAEAHLGGTLLYMAPEQMRAFRGVKIPLDARSDIYSLGVILFELLTGQFPFPTYTGSSRDIVSAMLHDRQAGVPHITDRPPGVTPAVEAIVQKCLDPDPACRYQSARELQADVNRQLENKPLQHAREKSLWERVGKFKRRHPRLVSFTTAFGFCSVLIFSLLVWNYQNGEEIKRQDAAAYLDDFTQEATAAQVHLVSQTTTEETSEICAGAEKALQKYRVMEDPNWQDQDRVRYLSPADRTALERSVASLLLLVSQAKVFDPAENAVAVASPASLNLALAWNEKAERYGAGEHVPHALWLQRAALYAMLGDTTRAEQFRALSRQTAAQTDQDKCLTAQNLIVQGRHTEALPLLKDVIMTDSRNIVARMLEGRCYEGLGQESKAADSYTVSIALSPQEAQPYFKRGLVRLRLKDYPSAREDFTRALELDPRNPDAFFNRAIALRGLNETVKAIEDLFQAEKLGAFYSRLYLLRARYREEIGDKDGAKQDKQKGLDTTPIDDQSWVARGVAKLGTNPQAALADFEEALKLNPNSLPALVNSASVLANTLNKSDEAVSLLNRVVLHYPNYTQARISRGLLLAKAGQRDAALQDAQEGEKRTSDPALHFRIAGIYAFTSKQDPDDRKKAFSLLKKALHKGYGFELVDRDTNLEPLRNTMEYQQLMLAVRVLRKA